MYLTITVKKDIEIDRYDKIKIKYNSMERTYLNVYNNLRNVTFVSEQRFRFVFEFDLFVFDDFQETNSFSSIPLPSFLLTNISYIYRACRIKPGKIKYFQQMVFRIQRRLSTNTTIHVYYIVQFKETILFRDEITVSICHTKNLS